MKGITSFINKYNVIKQIPVFADLNWFDIQKIANKAVISQYKKGDIVCTAGSLPDYFYCLFSGRLQAFTTNMQEQKENIDFILSGMYFGILSLFTGENHSMTFEAVNDSIILKIPKDDFHDILNSIPKLSIDINHTLSKRMRRKLKGSQSIFESTIISVYSPVKETGSSTYSINLALSLKNETEKKVIFVNIETIKEYDKHQHVDESKPILKWKVDPVNLNNIVDKYDEIIKSIIKDDLPIDLLNIVVNSEDDVFSKKIGHFVSSLVNDYHYVVVDLPSEMDNIVEETLTQSDMVHLISLDQEKDLKLIKDVTNRLKSILNEKFREDKIRVIIRAIQSKTYISFEEIDKFINYSVYKMLPYIEDSSQNFDRTSKSLDYYYCGNDKRYEKTVRRIAREIGNVLVGLVLGGGAALGIAHIGVIKVLEKENIPVDVIVGSSMGALIGGLWAIGKNHEELEKIAQRFENKRNLLELFDPVFPISGFIGGRAIERWLRRHLKDRTFYSTEIPLKIVSYDLTRREEIVINSGSIIDAVRQSIAIPGVLEPIRKKEKLIIDGGVLNPLPTNILARMGIKKMISVNVLQSPQDVSESFDIMQKEIKEKEKVSFLKSPLSFLRFRFSRFLTKMFQPNISDIIILTLQASEYEIAMQSARISDVNIHPDLVGLQWYELYRASEFIKRGEEAALKHLPKIKELIKE